jgi:hypothetical protein
MDSIHKINSKLNRHLSEMGELINKQELLLKNIFQDIEKNDQSVLPLKTTVLNLIEHGISKDEILAITSISSAQYEEIFAEKSYHHLPYALLTEEESNEFDCLLEEIQKSSDIQELLNPIQEGKRILFILQVLKRYQNEVEEINQSVVEDD